MEPPTSQCDNGDYKDTQSLCRKCSDICSTFNSMSETIKSACTMICTTTKASSTIATTASSTIVIKDVITTTIASMSASFPWWGTLIICLVIIMIVSAIIVGLCYHYKDKIKERFQTCMASSQTTPSAPGDQISDRRHIEDNANDPLLNNDASNNQSSEHPNNNDAANGQLPASSHTPPSAPEDQMSEDNANDPLLPIGATNNQSSGGVSENIIGHTTPEGCITDDQIEEPSETPLIVTTLMEGIFSVEDDKEAHVVNESGINLNVTEAKEFELIADISPEELKIEIEPDPLLPIGATNNQSSGGVSEYIIGHTTSEGCITDDQIVSSAVTETITTDMQETNVRDSGPPSITVSDNGDIHVPSQESGNATSETLT